MWQGLRSAWRVRVRQVSWDSHPCCLAPPIVPTTHPAPTATPAANRHPNSQPPTATANRHPPPASLEHHGDADHLHAPPQLRQRAPASRLRPRHRARPWRNRLRHRPLPSASTCAAAPSAAGCCYCCCCCCRPELIPGSGPQPCGCWCCCSRCVCCWPLRRVPCRGKLKARARHLVWPLRPRPGLRMRLACSRRSRSCSYSCSCSCRGVACLRLLELRDLQLQLRQQRVLRGGGGQPEAHNAKRWTLTHPVEVLQSARKNHTPRPHGPFAHTSRAAGRTRPICPLRCHPPPWPHTPTHAHTRTVLVRSSAPPASPGAAAMPVGLRDGLRGEGREQSACQMVHSEYRDRAGGSIICQR